MRWRVIVGLVGFLMAGCSNGVPFALETDEPVRSATLILRDEPIPMEKEADGHYAASWSGGEADGTIDVTYADGTKVICNVGYVTHGMGAQQFVIEQRQCHYSAEAA